MTAFTGHLILFVDVWTNFVQSDVEALSGYAFGGRSYVRARESESHEYPVYTNHTHINNVWRTWSNVWYISWIWLQLAKLSRETNEPRVKVKRYNIPTPNDPSLLHSLLSAEDVSFSAPSHRAIGVERQARGPEYAGHQRLVLAGVADADLVSIQDSCLS